MDYAGLETKLKTLTAASVGSSASIEWANEPVNPRLRKPLFVRASVGYGSTQSATLGRDGKNVVNGVLFINVFQSGQANSDNSLALVSQVLADFPKGDRHTITSGDIIIGVGYMGSQRKDEQFYFTPITVPFTAYLEAS